MWRKQLFPVFAFLRTGESSLGEKEKKKKADSKMLFPTIYSLIFKVDYVESL